MSHDLSGVSLNLIQSVDEASDFMSWLNERRPVLAIDTETSGLHPWSDKLRLVQVGDANAGWAIPWELWGGVALEALKKYDGDVVLHNAKFDVSFIENASDITMSWRRLHDTRIMAHLIDPVSPTGLKPLSSRLIDGKAHGLQNLLDMGMTSNKWTWATVPIDFQPYWAYAALDTVLTARLYEILKPQIDAEFSNVYELEMQVERIIMGMERRGCRIDVDFTQHKRNEIADYVTRTEEWILTTYGVKAGSNQKIVEVLQRDGIEFDKVTGSGAWALDKEVLEAIDHPLAKSVLMRRRAQKAVSTYFDNFLTMHAGGFLHPSINTLGARTGRMSISDPALQTLPRADEGNPFATLVRDCFIPREGNKLVSSDFDQVELRLFAHLSQDEQMIADVKSGVDPFTAMAIRIYNDPTITKKDPRRQLTKNATYAKFYGAGVTKFSQTAQIPVTDGEAFMAAYDATYPGVKGFQRMVERVALDRKMSDGVAWVRSPIGRKHLADDGKEYALVNYLIQGTAGDVFKQKLVDIDSVGLGDFMILPVHDEIILDVPEQDVDEAAQLVQATMRDDTNYSVPLTAGAEVYDRWGDKFR